MRKLHLMLVLAASLAPCANVQAAPADVPETGQTLCFDAAGAGIPCTSTGQDGDLKAGVTWPNPRFVAGTGAAVGCVTDKLTGLMWMRAPSTTGVIWTTALADANGLTLCGFSDWRLPNINELESLVNTEAASQATFLNAPAQGFTGVQAALYWTSTSLVGSSFNAWYVSMDDGSANADNKNNTFFVWPVRAGP